MIRQRDLLPGDRPLVAALLASLPAFSDEERAVALELVDHRLAHPTSDDYRFILSFSSPPGDGSGPEELAGYLCYGHTPMTRSTYDLYWIATSRAYARSDVARGLLARLESEMARAGGGLLRVETGSREAHGAGVHFFDALGFARTATVADFYAPGDDLIIFTKRVRLGAEPDVFGDDEVALQDAAFGYRDYAAERDFLFECARRFGEGTVRRVVAWAPGAGRHLQAFAEAGVAGAGVDASPAMIAYAERLLGARPGHDGGARETPGGHASRPQPPEIRFVLAGLDERAPLGPPAAPADLSFVLFSSIHLLVTPEAMVRHLHFAAELLRPGGVHVIEATHPGDLSPSGVTHTEWTEVRGDTTVDARFRIHVDRLSAERVVPVTLEVTRTTGKKGAHGAPRLKQEDRWFIPDLAGWRALLADVPELSLVATLGSFDVTVPHEHTAAWRLILVLKKVREIGS